MTMKTAFCIALVLGHSWISQSRAEFSELQALVERAPAASNAAGYVDVQALKQLTSDAGFGELVSAAVEDYWFLAGMDIARMRPNWEAGYATLTKPISAADLAARVNGYVDELRDLQVVWSPGDVYFVTPEEPRVGVLRPANRSFLSSWLSANKFADASPFLLEQIRQQSDTYLSLMLAIDLHEAFSVVPLAKRLETYDSLKANSADTIAEILASVQGASIIIGRRSLDECILKVQFQRSPASLKPIACALFEELLRRNGTAAPEVLSWKAEVEQNTLSFRGTITEASLGALLGIFSLQQQANRAAGSTDAARVDDRSEQQRVAYQSKHYFDEVGKVIERTRDHKSQTTGALAMWNDQRARQIDELPTVGVDPAMIEFGSEVASLLRGNALAVRGVNIAAGQVKAEQSLSAGYYRGGGYYGGEYYDPNSTADYQRVTTARARGNAYANYREVLSKIDELTSQTRRAMTQKYSMQF
jgi:hypothetical protein